MPIKSMLSRPIGLYVLLLAVLIGIAYIVLPRMFVNEEESTTGNKEGFQHPVPPKDKMLIGANRDAYHYHEAC